VSRLPSAASPSILQVLAWRHRIAVSVGRSFVATRNRHAAITSVMVEGLKDNLQNVISAASKDKRDNGIKRTTADEFVC
jgi:hypothetical protein